MYLIYFRKLKLQNKIIKTFRGAKQNIQNQKVKIKKIKQIKIQKCLKINDLE